MYEEELLQAESEHDGTTEQEDQTPASANNMYKNTRYSILHNDYIAHFLCYSL
jgi:hypothetical protein